MASIGAPAIALADEADTKRPVLVEPRLHLGIAGRIDDPPSLEATERAGVVLGGALRVQPASRFSVGLAYEHFDLGREQSGIGDLGTISVRRDLNTLWATLALSIVELEAVGIELELGPGLSWQSADVSGAAFAGTFASGLVSFSCEASGSANLALRGALGATGKLGSVAYLFGNGFVGLHSLSSDVLDGCAPGAGTATVLGLAAGVGLRLDVTPKAR